MRAVGAIFLLTLRGLLRSRFLLVSALLTLGVVLGLPAVIRDDGTLTGRAQVLIRYTLTAVSFLFSVGILGVAPGLVSAELESRRLQQALVKPVRFGSVWLGKWLALVAVHAVLLAAAFLLSDLALRRTLRPAAGGAADADGIRRARAVRAPVVESLEPAAVEARAGDLVREGVLPPETPPAEAARRALERLRVERQVVRPGGEKTWRFEDPGALPAGGRLSLRVQFLNASGNGGGSEGEWVMRDRNGRVFFSRQVRLRSMRPQELAVPPLEAAIEGPVTVTFRNRDPDAVLFHVRKGIRLLAPGGSYEMNLFRAYWLVLFRLALLAAIGLTMGSLFSSPVAVLASLFALALLGFSGYIGWVAEQDRFSEPHEHAHAHEGHAHEAEAGAEPTWSRFLEEGLKAAYRGANRVLAPLRELEPLERLADGEQVAWPDVGRGFARMIGLGAGLMALLAAFLFGRRETG